MDDEKWNYNISYRDDEDRLQYFLTVVFEGKKAPPEYAVGVLIKSVERLKASTDENLKGIQDLRASIQKSSNEANLLFSAIKKLTAWLVGLTAAVVVLTGLSIFILLHSSH